jgi:hypothetical protein
MSAKSILKPGNAMALNQFPHVVIFLEFCFLLLPLAGHAEQRSCGTHWTGWMKTQDSDKNPCPSQCERGEKLNVRTWGNAPDTQYDFQYQCYFPAPKQSAYESSPASVPTTPGQSSTTQAAAKDDIFPFIRGRVDDVSAANGAWLNWTSKLDPIPQNLRGKQAWFPVFEKFSVFLKQSPALATMQEFYPWLSFGVDESYQPLPRAQISMLLWPRDWVEPAPNTPDKIKLKNGAWGSAPAGYDLWINWFPLARSGGNDELSPNDWYKDAQGAFFRLQKPDQLIDGFPVHGGWLFVTAKNKPPLFIPVSQERALLAFMAQAQKQMSSVTEGNAGVNEALDWYNSDEGKNIRRQAIEGAVAGEKDPKKAAEKRAKAERDDAEQERQLRASGMQSASSSPVFVAAELAYHQWSEKLQAMSQVERNKPAFVKSDPDAFLGEDLVPASMPGAISLMQYNPEYVNRKLGKEVPQILIMAIGSSTDWARSAESLAKMTVRERVAIAIVERTKWSEIQGYLQ